MRKSVKTYVEFCFDELESLKLQTNLIRSTSQKSLSVALFFFFFFIIMKVTNMVLVMSSESVIS